MDVYASIDEVVEKLEKQIRKQKDKYKERKRISSKTKQAEKDSSLPRKNDDFDVEFEKQEDDGGEIVKYEKVQSKPMSPDEAVMQLELDNKTFMAFINSNTDEINIIYRLPNGNYSLITRG